MTTPMIVTEPESREPVTIDAAVLRALGEGDAAAWRAVVHRYGAVVAAAVRSFRLQDADALDAVQMTWLRLAENAHRVQAPDRLGGWLKTTARREVFRILRRDARQHLVLTEALVADLIDLEAGPEQRVIQDESKRILDDLVAELPPRRRSLVRALFHDGGSSYQEIARTVGIPPGGIGPTRQRILRQLRRRLDEMERAAAGTDS